MTAHVRRSIRIAVLLGALPLLLLAPGCAEDSASGEAPSAEAEVVSMPTRVDLSDGALKDYTGELAQKWLDENIMNGDVQLDAGRLEGTTTEAALGRFLKKMVADHLAEREEGEAGSVSVERIDWSAGLPRAVAKVIATEGFVYTNSADNIDPVHEEVRGALALLGDEADVDVTRFEGKTKIDDEDWNISLHLFFNRKTNEYVAFYSRAGWV